MKNVCLNLVSLSLVIAALTGCSVNGTSTIGEFNNKKVPPTTGEVGSSEGQPGQPDRSATPDSGEGFASSGTPPISYQLYIPASLPKGRSVPLVVVIHGCDQNAADMAAGTGWNNLADEKGFIVLYPSQTPGRHSLGCWRWFEPDHQTRDKGEPAEIVSAIREVKRLHPIDDKHIFVTGMSSGAATTATLLACYPEIFRAGAMHSGPAYGLARNEEEAKRLLMYGPGGFENKGSCKSRSFTGGIMVVQGTNDIVVNSMNAERIIQEIVGEAESKLTVLPVAFSQLSGTRTDYTVAGRLRGSLIMVSMLGHQWSGGRQGLPYNNPLGPNATQMMWEFFSSF